MTTFRRPFNFGDSWVGPVCAVVIAITAVGCAARGPQSISDRFIKQGDPSIDLGGPPPTASTDEYIAQLRALAAQARPRAKALSPGMLEARDPQLRSALAALAARPSADAHRSVALEYRRLGIPDAAFTHVSAAIRLDPKDAAAHDLRARIWRGWGLPGLGIADAKRAVALAPRSATAWNTLGLILEGNGSLTVAISAYLHAVHNDPDGAYAWNNLCRAWLRAGEGPAAQQACRRTLALDSSYTAAQIALAQSEQMTEPRRSPRDAMRTAAAAPPTLPGFVTNR